MWERARTFSTASTRLVGHYASEADLKAFKGGGEVQLSPYMYLQTPSRAENLVATQAQFDKLRAGVVGMQRDLSAKLGPRLSAEIARAAKEFGDLQNEQINLTVGEIVPLSVDRNDARALIYTTLMNVAPTSNGSSAGTNILTSGAMILVRGKIVMLSVNRIMKTPQDIKIVRRFTSDWVSAITTAN